VLPCVQNGDQSREARTQDTKDRSLCARDEAYDGEEEGKATDQDAVITCWGHWAYFGSMAYMKWEWVSIWRYGRLCIRGVLDSIHRLGSLSLASGLM